MKTPTPDVSAVAKAKAEEVKDKVAQKHGYQDWLHLNFTHFNNYFDGLNVGPKAKVRKEYMVYENEAMREYASACAKAAADEAEALYKDRIEKAGSELPSDYTEPLKSVALIQTKGFERGANWMKEQASVVIAKVKEDLQSVIDHQSRSIINAQEKHEKLKNLYEESTDEYIAVRKYLEQKDKEINELKIENHRLESAEMKLKNTEELLDQSKKEIEELKALLHNQLPEDCIDTSGLDRKFCPHKRDNACKRCSDYK